MDGYTLARRIRDRKAAGPTLILLTSAGLQEPAQARRAGIHAALLKPVKQSDLLDTIVSALGGRGAERERAPAAPRVPTRQLRVLLVEDNRVNQTMALRVLEKRGHLVTVAENGQQALDALGGGGRFDVVLMDVQMPVMNGLEATARIRAGEQGSDRHLPIVAMTAHAMRGDRERCLAAGMDRYLVKPIRGEELIATLESLAGTEAEPGNREAAHDVGAGKIPSEVPHVEESGRPHGDPAAVRVAMLEHLGGDLELARDLAGIFLDDRAEMMLRIETAIELPDAEALRVAAHTLKGAVGNFGATVAAAAALRLEKIGQSGNLDEAGDAWAELKHEIAALEDVLRSVSRPEPRPKARRAPVRPKVQAKPGRKAKPRTKAKSRRKAMPRRSAKPRRNAKPKKRHSRSARAKARRPGRPARPRKAIRRKRRSA
jgi:two-component system sensor histidine kinase/response regulator